MEASQHVLSSGALHPFVEQLKATVDLAIMIVSRLLSAVIVATAACRDMSTAGAVASVNMATRPHASKSLQDIVTWDEHSVFVRGERLMLFSGEFHPFRLPVPDLWLDVFQKLRSAGFNTVSFYSMWAQLEGKPGDFSAQGIFALEPFFEAAKQAGIYLIARPGPYINAEVTGGGFPGWLQRAPVIGRTRDFLPYTENYVKEITAIIAKAQITNGGPVILFQPENEYTLFTANVSGPDPAYFAAVGQTYRDLGIVVPFVSNDQYPHGLFAPGTGTGAVDIYGWDDYPLGLGDCSHPHEWPDGKFPTYYLALHRAQSPSTPHAVMEFQGGSFDPWGGAGLHRCATLVNEQFARVFYKMIYAAKVTIFSIYTVMGATNWGNLGHPNGYTSYDYGAVIAEDRNVTRAKYSEVKLQANFLKVSPEYLVANAQPWENGSYVSTSIISTARLASEKSSFYVVRHASYNTVESTSYRMNIPSSAGNLSIPLHGNLTLNGRDSKIHVVDYDVGEVKLLYSTAEVFTWKKYKEKTVLVLYGGADEAHEIRFLDLEEPEIIEGSDLYTTAYDGSWVLNWAVSSERQAVKFPQNVYVYFVSREEAFTYWVLDLPAAAPAHNYTTAERDSVIVKGGYLLRSAALTGTTLDLTGDVNTTTNLEILGGASDVTSITFNGQALETLGDSNGVLSTTFLYIPPRLSLPLLSDLAWKYVDSLPEVRSSYNDSAWAHADHSTTNNTQRPLTTPTSLYGSDYGFHAGNLLTRGHFTATGDERYFFAETWGGFAYASAVYLNDTLIAGWAGAGANSTGLQNATLPALTAGASYVLTVLMDNMGLEEDFVVGGDQYKNPRGVVRYELDSRSGSDVTWSITGNLGGEDHQDRTRGPLNEGGLWAERLGYHLPGAPVGDWAVRSPFEGIATPGVGFFATNFALDMPAGYDVPLAFVFANTTGAHYRCQLYVNGYQFGKYVNNVGPQTRFPVPEGILNYHGANYVALSLWGFDKKGNRLTGFDLVPTAQVRTGYGKIGNAPMPEWKERKGAY